MRSGGRPEFAIAGKHIGLVGGEMMLSWAIAFLILALIAGVLGFGGIAGTATAAAQILFFVFMLLLVVSALASALGKRPPM